MPLTNLSATFGSVFGSDVPVGRSASLVSRPGRSPSERHRLHAGSGGLVHKPARAPVRVASSGLEHPDLDRRGHLVRAPGRTVGPVDEPSQGLVLVPTQPSVYRLA
jgi:hypothetical protein